MSDIKEILEMDVNSDDPGTKMMTSSTSVMQPLMVDHTSGIAAAGSSGAARLIPSRSSASVFNLPGEKVVMATPPVQVVMQQAQQHQSQTATLIPHQQRIAVQGAKSVITKLIVSKNSTGGTVLTRPAPVTMVQGVHQAQNLNIKTIPLQKNNISVSPVKGGFKIPISPAKHPLKFSVLPPGSNSLVKRISLDKTRTVSLQPKGAANFQFQTLPQANINKISTNNPNQTFTIQTMNQFQAPNARAPCTVRLIPANGGQVTQPTLIPVQTTNNDQNSGTIVGTGQPKIIHQPFVSFQQVRPMQIKQPRLIMPANTAPAPKIATLSQSGSVVKTSQVATNVSVGGLTLVPTKYIEQMKKPTYQQYIHHQQAQQHNQERPKVVTPPPDTIQRPPPPPVPQSSVTLNGKVHKPCNCTKSMCLKLYCECFANGHFCEGCNCVNCHNNLEYDQDRSKAIRSCLDRNPYAFRPKIGRGRDDSRTHQKGCNCRRSGCLKNYCECYEARIPCTSRCKCIGCKNLERNWPTGGRVGRKQRASGMTGNQVNHNHPLMSLADAAAARCQQQQAASSRLSSQIEEMGMHRTTTSRHSKMTAGNTGSGEKPPSTFFTKEVVEATCMCLLAQAEEAEKSNLSVQIAEQMILEEYGRCLMQIIEAARKTKVAPPPPPTTATQTPNNIQPSQT